MPKMSSDDVETILNLTADVFEASPIRMFTREEVIRVLRAMPDEIARTLLEMELQRALAVQSPICASKPS